MTTADPFTTAARAEAERIYRSVPGSYLDSMLRMAEWARTHLAAQEPTDEEIAAARIAIRRVMNDPSHNYDLTDLALAALSAARAARGGTT